MGLSPWSYSFSSLYPLLWWWAPKFISFSMLDLTPEFRLIYSPILTTLPLGSLLGTSTCPKPNSWSPFSSVPRHLISRNGNFISATSRPKTLQSFLTLLFPSLPTVNPSANSVSSTFRIYANSNHQSYCYHPHKNHHHLSFELFFNLLLKIFWDESHSI